MSPACIARQVRLMIRLVRSMRRESTVTLCVSTTGLFAFVNKTLRYSETVLEVGDPLYVLGTVQFRDDDTPRFVKGGQVFIVSDKGERALQSRYGWFSRGCWALAFLAGAGSVGLVVYHFTGR